MTQLFAAVSVDAEDQVLHLLLHLLILGSSPADGKLHCSYRRQNRPVKPEPKPQSHIHLCHQRKMLKCPLNFSAVDQQK